MTLFVDASVAVPACLAEAGFDLLPDPDLVAPPLMWSETRSVLHELAWRGELTAEEGTAARDALASCRVRRAEPPEIGSRAWRVADELGWAKTYDAEYVALALPIGCRVVTLDRRFARGAERLGVAVTPGELV